MERDELDQHLSQMSTQWTMVLQAHGGEADAANAALAGLAQRYLGVVYRYLLGAVRDPDAAAELAQELALRILRGGFRHADPRRGRFRDYLKTALIHLVDDYKAAQRDRPRPLPPDMPAGRTPPVAEREADFLESWREELLNRTWTALAAAQPMYHAVLLFRVENPDVPSPQMAEQIATRLGTPMRPDQVRKALQRSHARFAELLLDEVATSLGNPSREELAEEVRELDLLKYCRTALERRI
jgi:DNA-directed RNA polymerase specialized sigma24 family protein